jgi:glycosyltransferase involved in cell wall biosynthesis
MENTNKLSVLFVHRIFAIYRKPIYDILANKYDFLLLHARNQTGIKQTLSAYSKTIRSFNYSKNPTHVLLETFSDVFRHKPKVVIYEFAIGMLFLTLMLLLCKMKGIKFILYSHGYDRATGFNPKKSMLDRYRLFLINWADATVIYSHADKSKLSAYCSGEKIFVAQNTLDRAQFLTIKNRLEEEGKTAIKKRLGFVHPYNLIFVGRIIKEKMPEIVLQVYELLNNKLPNQVGIHFVGGGHIDYLQEIVAKNNWQDAVKFYGAIYDDTQTGELLFASDILIVPNNIGLSVNHAFSFNCPVVTFAENNVVNHGPEIEYVVHNETGFVVPDTSVEKMSDTILDYLQNERMQRRMKNNIQQKIEHELTTENMVKGFTDAIQFVLKK